MNSIFAQLYLSLISHLLAQVPAIRYADQDMGQLENYDLRPAVSWPCILIDMAAATYTNLGLLVQDGALQINLRLGFVPYSQANSLTPEAVRRQALEYYELEHEIFKALQGWAPVGANDEPLCQPLMRSQASTEQRDDDIRVRVVSFTTTFFDDAATPVTTTQVTPLQIT